ncbi:MAG: hypothetical protein KDJ36_12400 [Hyphomicrobiaceae bacterium]|nr:hypothetical protein [Hyphomicrobiaceae bacterium]
MPLLTLTTVAAFVLLTLFADTVGLPAILVALLPAPLAFAGTHVLSRLMRAAGTI